MSHATLPAINAELLSRYGGDGSRYTSYPTVAQFKGDIRAQAYADMASLCSAADQRSPLALYVHVPFCFSPCFYCGCNKIVTRDLSRADGYVARVLREIGLRGRYFGRGHVIEQMHFGGGTPSFLPKTRLIELIDQLDAHFKLSDEPSRDYSIEIDPRASNEGELRLLSALGFNRLSLGVQDFDIEVQRAVNRVQPADVVTKVYDAARAIGFRSINFDLIYGLPRQTQKSFAATLERVVHMRPDRLAVYGYADMQDVFKAQRQIRADELPDAAARIALLQMTIRTLCEAGYEYIGMDHFALPGDELARARHAGTLQRSFQGYTTHADLDLVNLGVSAIGKVGTLYVQNHKSLKEYEQALDDGRLPLHRGKCLSADDIIRRDVIRQIMCEGTVDMTASGQRHGIVFDEYFRPELSKLLPMQTDGLLDIAGGRIALTAVGHLLMRAVAQVFDAYAAANSGTQRMARVI